MMREGNVRLQVARAAELRRLDELILLPAFSPSKFLLSALLERLLHSSGVGLAQLDGLRLGAKLHVEQLDRDRKRHREVNVAL